MNFTIKNHPLKNDVLGRPLYQLLNKKPIVESALSSWSEGKIGGTEGEINYNINYFSIELEMINNEIKKHNC